MLTILSLPKSIRGTLHLFQALLAMDSDEIVPDQPQNAEEDLDEK